MKNQAGTQAVETTPAPPAPVHEDFEQTWREAAAAAQTAIENGEVPTPTEAAEQTAGQPAETEEAEATTEEQPEGAEEEQRPPTPQEAYQNREWRRQEKAKLQQQYDAAADMLVKRAERALAIESAYRKRDFDGIAK